MVSFEHVQEKRGVPPGLSFCSRLYLVSSVDLYGRSWGCGVHCRVRFKMPKPIILSLTLQVKLSPQLCLGNEAKSLLLMGARFR